MPLFLGAEGSKHWLGGRFSGDFLVPVVFAFLKIFSAFLKSILEILSRLLKQIQVSQLCQWLFLGFPLLVHHQAFNFVGALAVVVVACCFRCE